MLIGFEHMGVYTSKEKLNGYHSSVSALSDFVMNWGPHSLVLFFFLCGGGGGGIILFAGD